MPEHPGILVAAVVLMIWPAWRLARIMFSDLENDLREDWPYIVEEMLSIFSRSWILGKVLWFMIACALMIAATYSALCGAFF